jgi:formin 2
MPSPRAPQHPPPLPLPPGARAPGQWQLSPASGGPGAPPPPPPPRAAATKALHWEALPASGAAAGTLWGAHADADGAESSLVDSAEIESLFANKPTPAAAATPAGRDALGRASGGGGGGGGAPRAAPLLDSMRARNCEIMLRRACRSAPAESLIEALCRFELARVTPDAVAGMAAFIPESAEATKLRAAPAAALTAPAERFMAAVSRAPRWAATLRVAAFAQGLDAGIASATASLATAQAFAVEVTSSASLPGVMRAILSVGNVMNAGTARGGAKGFRLASLEQLSRTRSAAGKTTLLHYLAKLLQAKLPALLTWHASLPSLSAASRVDLPAAAAEVASLRAGAAAAAGDAERAAADADADAGDDDGAAARNSRAFAANLRAFLADAAPKLAAAEAARGAALAAADAAVAHFGETPGATTLADICAALGTFKAAFEAAVADNAREKAREKATERALEERIAKEGARRAAGGASTVSGGGASSSLGAPSSGGGGTWQEEVARAVSRRRGGMGADRDADADDDGGGGGGGERRPRRPPAVLTAPTAPSMSAQPDAAPAPSAASSLFGAIKSRFGSPPRPGRVAPAADPPPASSPPPPPRLKSPPRGRAEEASHARAPGVPRFKSPSRGRHHHGGGSSGGSDAPAKG